MSGLCWDRDGHPGNVWKLMWWVLSHKAHRQRELGVPSYSLATTQGLLQKSLSTHAAGRHQPTVGATVTSPDMACVKVLDYHQTVCSGFLYLEFRVVARYHPESEFLEPGGTLEII